MGAFMGGEGIAIYGYKWLPNQTPPDGYEICGVFGEGFDGKVGTSYFWERRESNEYAGPFETRWSARRDAIKHSQQQQK